MIYHTYLQQSCPCDVYPGKYRGAYVNVAENSEWTPELSRAPRESVFGSQVSKPRHVAGKENWFSTEGSFISFHFE